jgi:hypothetical protein
MSGQKRQKAKRGPKPETLKLKGDWQTAVGRMLKLPPVKKK